MAPQQWKQKKGVCPGCGEETPALGCSLLLFFLPIRQLWDPRAIGMTRHEACCLGLTRHANTAILASNSEQKWKFHVYLWTTLSSSRISGFPGSLSESKQNSSEIWKGYGAMWLWHWSLPSFAVSCCYQSPLLEAGELHPSSVKKVLPAGFQRESPRRSVTARQRVSLGDGNVPEKVMFINWLVVFSVDGWRV